MKRRQKFHIHNSTIILLALGIVVLINFITHRHYKKWDLSQTKQFSLSDQTLSLLHKLDKKIELIGFFDKTGEAAFHDLAEKKLADLDVDIGLAEQHDIRQKNIIVVVGPQKTLKITELSEEELTNALTKVTLAQQKKIYFISGHFEKSISDTENEGLSQLKQELENSGYAHEEISLLQRTEIPSDCHVLIIAGAQKDFLPKEKEMIKAYLNKAGSLFYLIDPKTPLGLSDLLHDWNVKAHDNLIVDPTSQLFLQDPRTIVALNYSEHEIVKKLAQKKAYTLFPWARSFESTSQASTDIVFTHLIKSTDQAWGETTYGDKRFKFDAGKDLKGPLTVAAVLTKKIELSSHVIPAKAGIQSSTTDTSGDPKETGKESIAKLVLFGSSSILSNNALYAQGNRDLVFNTLSWLAGEEEHVSIRPTKAGVHSMNMNKAQAIWVGFIFIIVIPLGLLAFGIVYWILRKRK